MTMDAVKKMDEALEKLLAARELQPPGLGVIVYKDGQEAYSCFRGCRSLGENKRPMTRKARFRIASISKTFVAFTLLQLWAAGKLDLDGEAGDYLGFNLRHPLYPHIPITLRMLACHTSSLRDGKLYSIPPDKGLEEFFTPEGEYWEKGAHFAPAGEMPGAYFSYANINYGLLGTVIEAVTGERFDKYQKEHILKELDTAADYVPGNFSGEEFARLGAVYQKKDDRGIWDEAGPWQGKIDDYQGAQPPRDSLFLQNPYAEDRQESYSLANYRPGRNATIFSPAGGLRISCEELAHALEMLLNEGSFRGQEVLAPPAFSLLTASQWEYDPVQKNGATYGGAITNYGLGTYRMVGLCQDPQIEFLGHTGEAFGLLSALCIRPGTRDGFLYVLNGTAMDVDKDLRSQGRYSGNSIWEEYLAEAIWQNILNPRG